MALLSVQDIPASVARKADAVLLQKWIDGLNGQIARVAPCILTGNADIQAEAQLILLGAITRWSTAGTGMLQSGQAGQFGFSIDTRQGSFGYTLTPSEENRLLALCSSGDAVSEGERFYSIRPGYQPDPPQDAYRW